MRRILTANNPRNTFSGVCSRTITVPGNAPPLPQSRQSPLPPLVPFEPVLPDVCRSCGSPIHAYEKFCGICGSPISEHDLTVQPEPEIPTSAPPRVCTSCGPLLFETGKFCGICGASSDSTAKPHSPLPAPKINTSPADLQPPPAIIKICRSCGNPLSGT
jgi:predicted amidophosphoribosyltransferase